MASFEPDRFFASLREKASRDTVEQLEKAWKNNEKEEVKRLSKVLLEVGELTDPLRKILRNLHCMMKKNKKKKKEKHIAEKINDKQSLSKEVENSEKLLEADTDEDNGPLDEDVQASRYDQQRYTCVETHEYLTQQESTQDEIEDTKNKASRNENKSSADVPTNSIPAVSNTQDGMNSAVTRKDRNMFQTDTVELPVGDKTFPTNDKLGEDKGTVQRIESSSQTENSGDTDIAMYQLQFAEYDEEIKKLKFEKEGLQKQLENKQQVSIIENNQAIRDDSERAKQHHNNRIRRKSGDDIEQVHVLNEQLHRKIWDLERSKTSLEESKDQLRTKVEKLNKQLHVKDMALERSNTDLKDSKERNDQLATRLSKVAASNLRHNNPNIADLSDTDRPTKLAEKYSQLYDNEWTDTFSELETHQFGSTTKIISYLLEILMDCFMKCQEIANEQIQSIKAMFLFPSTSSKEVVQNVNLHGEHEQTITDLRKQLSNSTSKYLYQVIKENYSQDLKKYKTLHTYLQLSTELCWKMVIQTPPLYLDGFSYNKNDTFDRNIFRPYTKDGKHIKFLVWPPLFLHEEGPILCKGTAQGMDKKSRV